MRPSVLTYARTMLPLLLLAFIVVPIIELAVIVEVRNYLGLPPTILLLLLDSIVGAVLVKREGRRAWDNFRRAIAETRWPGDEVTQGALILVGGALLLTPGFVTDAIGLLAVIPPSRALASRVIRRWITPAPIREAGRFAQQHRSRRDAEGSDRRGDDRRGGRERGRDASRGGSGRARGPRGEVLDAEVVSVERDEPRAGERGPDEVGPAADGAEGAEERSDGPGGGSQRR